MSSAQGSFDPYALLTALERHRVVYVLVGGFARIIQGTEELTDGVDVVPSMKSENLRRLERSLADVEARLANGNRPALDPSATDVIELRTDVGRAQARSGACRHTRGLRRSPARRRT